MFLEKKSIIQNELTKKNIDSYLLIGRESSIVQDPVCDILGLHFIGLTGVLFTKNKCIALTNSNDYEGYKQAGIYDEVILYKQFEDSLLEKLKEYKIKTVAVNFSEDDPSADGLSHGLYLKLSKTIDKEMSLISAYEIVLKVRGIKSSSEVKKITTSAEESVKIFETIAKKLKKGDTDKEIFKMFQHEVERQNYDYAWHKEHCPGIFLGPVAPRGHMGPSGISAEDDFCMTVDFGVKKDGYASDLQRVYFFTSKGEVPEELNKAFETCKQAVRLAADFIKAGVTGFEVDKVARDYVVSKGYEEWNYALGHQVGREAHDGGTILAPAKERYNKKELIHTPIDEGNIFTLELGVATKYGYVGLEEMVVVGKTSGTFLVPPQEKIFIVKI